MGELLIYHGSQQIIAKPELRASRFFKDFARGFYCTLLKEQAIRWATRYPVTGYVSEYRFMKNPNLKYKYFDCMTEEWLDFIASCRCGQEHDYDIVEGPMANDTIFNYVQDFSDGRISREAFWALAKFNKPTHQICFHTLAALETLTYRGHAANGS